ncbi:MAG: magnesium transporter, partial [Firmicutes bacterium]|nr:magnesium transporter [Bacillota bacterium]
ITVDDIIDVIEEEATEDFQLGAAVTPLEDDYGNLGVWELYKKRAGWLVILVFINLLSSSVMAVFEELLAATIALTFFVPLLIATGGNAGQQSSTLMVRSLATGDTQLSQWFKVLLKELGVGLSLGVTLGLASWVLGVVQGGLRIGLVVSLSMTVIVVIANLVGVTMPFVLTKLKKDPAVASGPLLTTIVDVAGLLIYLSIAKMLL